MRSKPPATKTAVAPPNRTSTLSASSSATTAISTAAVSTAFSATRTSCPTIKSRNHVPAHLCDRRLQ